MMGSRMTRNRIVMWSWIFRRQVGRPTVEDEHRRGGKADLVDVVSGFRPVRAMVVVCVVLAVTSLGKVLFRPTTDQVGRDSPADAVVALAGAVRSVDAAQRLAEQGVARELVLSHGYGSQDPQMKRLCDTRPTGYRITCFVPRPDSTRGEAREIQRLTQERGWNDLIVVAPTYHVSRARMIVKRCHGGRLRMVDAHVHIGPCLWAYSLLYQSAAFLKDAVRRGC
jgi:hypothetical protein